MDMLIILAMSAVFISFIIILSRILVRKQNAENDKKVVLKTKLITTHDTVTGTTTTSTGSVIGRGIVGAAVAGPLGAAVGAATAKQNTVNQTDTEYTFKVWWGDGTETVEKCKYEDYWYKRFIEKIEI